METESDAWVEKAWLQKQTGPLWHAESALVSQVSTPATDLEAITQPLLSHAGGNVGASGVLGAVAAHPNTPPALLAGVIGRLPTMARALCANPIAPFLLLEQPLFLGTLTEAAQLALLGEADCPPVWAQQLAVTGGMAKTESVAAAARLHIALAGESVSTSEWEAQIREYFQRVCAQACDVFIRPILYARPVK